MRRLKSRSQCTEPTTKGLRRLTLSLRIAAIVVLSSAPLALGAGVANAAYPVVDGPLVLTTGSPTPTPGATIRLEGSGYAPGAQVSIDAHSTVVHLATVTADATGFIKATVTIPTSLASGTHELTATGPAPDGGTRILGISFKVQTGSLPFTGFPAAIIAGVALVAAACGVVLIVLGRRRRTA